MTVTIPREISSINLNALYELDCFHVICLLFWTNRFSADMAFEEWKMCFDGCEYPGDALVAMAPNNTCTSEAQS